MFPFLPAAMIIKTWGTTQEAAETYIHAVQQPLTFAALGFICSMIIRTWGTTQEAADSY
jgi:hypothetical protein